MTVILTNTKTCSICGEEKPKTEFYTDRSNKWTGVRSECKPCSKMSRSYNARTPEFMRSWRKVNKEKQMLWAARSRARRSGLEFNIDLEDIVIPSFCPALGIPLVRDQEGRGQSNSPALDRVDNARGYVKGNVVVVSNRANSIKRDATIAELRALADFYEAQAKNSPNSGIRC